MGSLPRDFKSLASADFAILAYLCTDIWLLCNAKVKSLASACFAIPARFCGIFVSPPAAVCAGSCLAAADFSARRRFFGVPLSIFFPCAADLSFARRLFAEDRASVGVHSLPRRRCASRGAAGERKRPPLHAKRRPIFWRRHPDLNRGVRALQALALPLGYSAKK